MSQESAREKVLSAFHPETFYYSHVLPFEYDNWIDGMAWVGILCGAAYKVGDTELAGKCEKYLKRLLEVGKDARNFAPTQLKNDWKPSKTIQGYWYEEKPQSFAGPAGLRFAIDNGASLNDPFQIKSRARLMVLGGWSFGYLVRWFSWLRQHVNSMFLAYLVLGKKPPTSMLWLCEDNPFYSYIAGVKCETVYPDMHRMSEGETVERSEVVPLCKRKPSSWVFRQWLKGEYIREGDQKLSEYTPAAELVGFYLQSTL